MKILVVDDEPQMQKLFEQRFRREIREGKVTLQFAQSGEEALNKLPDTELIIILSDINMPGMSGLQLLQRIRSLHPELPPAVMMVTAYGDNTTRQQALSSGADDFFTKPIDFVALKGKLEQFR